MQFHERLQKLREQAGFSNAKAFAKALHIPYTTYQNYEAGISEPKASTLVRMASTLHTSIDKLLGYQPPSPDDFEKCRAFVESAHSGNINFRVVTTSEGDIGIEKNRQYRTVFASKEAFILFVQYLKRAFSESQDYNWALSMFISEQLSQFDAKQDAEMLQDRITQIEHAHRQLAPIIAKIIANPNYAKFFEDNPQLLDKLKNTITMYDDVMAKTNKQPTNHQPTPFLGPFPTGKESDKADSPHADQAKEKAADPKANGKHKKD